MPIIGRQPAYRTAWLDQEPNCPNLLNRFLWRKRMNDRYQASGNQVQSQPGSDGQVLRNKLGITDPDDMNEVELLLLNQLYQRVLGRKRQRQTL